MTTRRRFCWALPAWKRARISLFALLLGAFAALFPSVLSAQSVSMADVDKAVLVEEWKTLADDLLKTIDNDPTKDSNPVLRLIKGHACLALNRNNESVGLFLSVVAGDDLQKCRRWADEFHQNHPDEPIARYFKGDVLARQGKWEEAIAVFGGSGTVKHPLICNARGVIYLQLEQFERANKDLSAAAVGSEGRLADAYANLGAYQIQKRADPEMGIKCFSQALKLSKDFAFAYYGRACLRVIRGPLDEEEVKKAAAEDFEKALQHAGEALPLLLADLPLANDKDSQALLAIVDNPGSAFVSDTLNLFTRVQANIVPGVLSGAVKDKGTMLTALKPAVQVRVIDELRSKLATQPGGPAFLAALQKPAIQNLRDSRVERMKIEGHLGLKGLGAGGAFDITPRDTVAGDIETLRNIGGSKPGGISVSFEGSTEDLGDWPFTARFAVMY